MQNRRNTFNKRIPRVTTGIVEPGGGPGLVEAVGLVLKGPRALDGLEERVEERLEAHPHL
jgi:hypothetical protein